MPCSQPSSPIRFDIPATSPTQTYSQCDSYGDRNYQQSSSSVNSICVIILAVLVGIVLWNMQRNAYGMLPIGPLGAISSMLGRVTSARITSSATPANDQHLSPDINEKMSAVNNGRTCVINTTHCKDDNCKNFQSMDPSLKAEFDAEVIEAKKKYPKALTFVWAPWCAHCHNAMPTILEAAKELKDPVIMINCEMVSRSMLSKEGVGAQVTHFPFLTCQGKIFNGRMDKMSIKEFVEGSEETLPSTETPTSTDDDSKESAPSAEESVTNTATDSSVSQNEEALKMFF